MKVVVIILARSGSKGLPKKNIIDFCGKPLLYWTIKQCKEAGINQIFVSSDSDEILNLAEVYGVNLIERPASLSSDTSTSESGWLHAVKYIEKNFCYYDWILAPQVTSPLRSVDDIKNGIHKAASRNYDSLFSCSPVEDLFLWEKKQSEFKSINYDWQNRKRRQDIDIQYIENGSFYLFRPEIIHKFNNRFGGRIGVVEMEFWKMFEIDSNDDLRMCSALMNEFILSKGKYE